MPSRSIHALWARGHSYDELHKENKENEALWNVYRETTSFKFVLSAVHHRIPQQRIKETIESFSYMDFLGPIDMRHPDITLTCMEECTRRVSLCIGCNEFLFADIPPDPSAKRSEDDGEFRQAYFGRLVRFTLNVMRACTSLKSQIGEEGETRQLITMFDVKKRVFYGNTSMEAEISLLMANQAQVSVATCLKLI
jgi:tRNA (guanine10-N2)-methyltransferase